MAEKTSKSMIRIELTPEQKEHVRRAAGLEVSTPDLTPEELEERVAPLGNLNMPVGPADGGHLTFAPFIRLGNFE